MEQKKISIVIPAYNEQAVIAQTIAKIQTWLKDHFLDYEIIVVDDGSTDNTLAIIQKIPGIIVLRNLRNHGKGYTVRKGVLASSGEWILFMDADNSTDIVELNKLWPYTKDFLVIIGSRALSQSVILASQNKFKVFLGKLGNLLVRALLVLPIKDTQCGFKLFHRQGKSLFAQMITSGWGFDFEIMWLAKKAALPIKEVPVVWENNKDSKVTIIGYVQTLVELIKIRVYYFFKKDKFKNQKIN